MKEESNSIKFFKVVIEDTLKKYTKLKEEVEVAAKIESTRKEKIKALKNNLIQVKREYFSMKRK